MNPISRQTIIIIPLLTGRCKKSEFFTNALKEVVAVTVAMVADCLQVCSVGYLTTSPNTTSTIQANTKALQTLKSGRSPNDIGGGGGWVSNDSRWMSRTWED